MGRITVAVTAVSAILTVLLMICPAYAAEAAGDGAHKAAVATNEFGIDLYRKLSAESSDNIFFSPFSIETALAMTYAGARGTTAAEMEKVLHLDGAQEATHSAFKDFIAGINSQGKEGCKLSTANALWGQKGHEFLKGFVDLTKEDYGAGLQLVDFGRSEEARKLINDWVSENTERKIQGLIPAGILTRDTRLVLTNAVYFKGAWVSQFDESATADKPFTLLSGEKVSVPMMSQTKDFRYAEGAGFSVLDMPYKGCDIAMTIFLPVDPAGVSDFESTLSVDEIEGCVTRLEMRKVIVAIPKARMTQEFSLADTLAAMGMKTAFSDGADFSGMDGKKDLSISAVLHKSFVDIDERGTEAAAATGVVVGVTSMPVAEEPKRFIADHPFVFLIRDTKTGAIIFIGRMMDPKQPS